MTADIEMLPLPKPEPQVSVAGAHEAMPADALEDYFDTEAVQSYARAVAEHNVKERDAVIEALRTVQAGLSRSLKKALVHGKQQAERAELLAEALRMIEQGSPVEAPDLNDWADADERVDVVENNLRWHFGQIARAALRDHDKEGKDG